MNANPDISDLVREHLQAVRATHASLGTINEREMFLMSLRDALQRDFPSAMGSPHIDGTIVDCIGHTRLVRIRCDRLFPSLLLPQSSSGSSPSPLPAAENRSFADVVAKVEFTNPGLSVKDRIAREMIEAAEADGKIQPGVHTIVDITSGNTGIAYGMVAASRGYRAVQIIPESYSVERRALMMALGVRVVVTKKEDGILGAIKVYNETLVALGDAAYAPRQFDNPANLRAHVEHTGPEIWEQCGGRVDAIVAGMGTGGTLSGVTRFLRSRNPAFLCIAVEPTEQSLLNGDAPGPHGIQGISPSFLPTNARVEEIDEVIRCPTSEAMATARRLAREEGIAVGISAGANVWAACQVAARPEMAGKRIVTILPSAAERYLSTALYESLLEDARNLPMATFDPATPATGIDMYTLESHQKGGTVFRPGFKVT